MTTMASRPIWRGHLRLALVSCPVALHTIVLGARGLHFHLINPDTGHRVRMATLDAESDHELSRRDLVKGFEFEKDRYVLLEDEDFEQARIDSSSVLSITKFVEAGSIEPIFYDSAYYIVPDGDSGLDVFVVLREALRHARVAALSRVVLTQREHPVAIFPSGKGLVCYTLHQPSDLWNPAPAYEDLPTEPPEPSMVDLAEQLINRQRGRFQPADAEDRYETKLREVIEAKLRGEGIAPEPEPPPSGGNVVDLMAALKASLQHDNAPAKAKAAPAKHTPAKDAPAKRASTKPAPAKRLAAKHPPAKQSPAKHSSARDGAASSQARKRA